MCFICFLSVGIVNKAQLHLVVLHPFTMALMVQEINWALIESLLDGLGGDGV